MWRTRFARTWDWLRSRRLAGEDEHHMYYFEYVAKGKPERRCVEYKDRVILNSSDRMPIQWWSWLHNRRDTVPTPDEIARSELQKEILAEKVAILEAEDEKQRLRQFAGAAHDLSKEEKRARRRKDVILEMRNAASPHSAKNSGVAVSPARERRIDNEELRRNEDEEPSGAGEGFQPGSWNPSNSRRRGR